MRVAVLTDESVCPTLVRKSGFAGQALSPSNRLLSYGSKNISPQTASQSVFG